MNNYEVEGLSSTVVGEYFKIDLGIDFATRNQHIIWPEYQIPGTGTGITHLRNLYEKVYGWEDAWKSATSV